MIIHNQLWMNQCLMLKKNDETGDVDEEDSNDDDGEYDVCEDDDNVPIERPLFSLGMRFSNAVEAREFIIQMVYLCE